MSTHVNVTQSTPLCEIMGRYGSDKGSKDILQSWHNYTTLYYTLFKEIKDAPLRVFELGLGTNNTSLASNMGANGKPGASLRGWAEFFPNAKVFGADIDTATLFQTDRIRTFYCDQTFPFAVQAMWNQPSLEEGFDIIIDDGLHEFPANECFLEHSIHKLKPNGFYIIEDILNTYKQAFLLAIPKWREKYQGYTFEYIELPSQRNRQDNAVILIHRRG